MAEYDSEYGEQMETEKRSLKEIAEEKLDSEFEKSEEACGV